MDSSTLIRANKAVLSFFGIGYSKYAPGTIASLVFLPIIYFFAANHNDLLLYLGIGLTVLGTLLIIVIRNNTSISHDPSWIVIDELAGMCFVFIAINPTFFTLVVGFLCFRYFDIHKWGLVRFFDTRSRYSICVMLDDCVAGIQTNVILQLLLFFY
ncbi:MAG: phosphatidylglycerophosphatase A [Methylacidiphilales bacterium]|nr:phosphatidylglycerophosphatase A [Candidatus Methylacidiphilales bacterium]